MKHLNDTVNVTVKHETPQIIPVEMMATIINKVEEAMKERK